MVNNRSFIKTSPSCTNIYLRARIFTTTSQSPSFLPVHTRSARDAQLARYPCVESVMDSSGVQPHVHDVCVSVTHGTSLSRFRIFFKRHANLPKNGVLDMQGDVVIMRIASKNPNSVVNLRSSDRQLIDFVVASVVPKLRHFQGRQRIRLPREFHIARSRR